MRATIIVSRGRDGDAEKRAREDAVASQCAADSGAAVLLTPDLYHVPDDSPLWVRLAGVDGHVLLASWLHARPVEWLWRRRFACVEQLDAFHLGAFDDPASCAAAILGRLPSDERDTPGAVERLEAPVGERWYPVVDRSRCDNCHHCLQFCLFGVHQLDENGQVFVANPDSCKPGCPACSRICPNGAIIFPLYDKDPAIAGAPGLLMQPDAAARRMFYARTKRPCPVCGATAQAADGPARAGFGPIGLRPAPSAPAALCEECGRPRPDAPVARKPEPSPVHDEIDALIDALDDLQAEG